jgi:haloalkane dehalogenase
MTLLSNTIEIDGSTIHYVESGTGNPIVFLHGIPTSSYLWRNIIPHLAPLGRCIAPDLLGLGKSDKPDIDYTIDDHIYYMDQFIQKLGLTNITFVVHDWGSLIGFHLAMKYEKICRGLVFYESYLRPFNEDDISLPLQEQLNAFKTEKDNYLSEILNTPYFVDKALSQGLLQPLSSVDMLPYREPFMKNGTGKALLGYLHEISHAKPSRIDDLITQYSKQLMKSAIPKLMLYSLPGFNTTIQTVNWAKDNLPHVEITEVGEELHYAQESNPKLMGEAISVWFQAIV